MGQQSTLQSVVTRQLRVHGLELVDLLNQYPHRSFVDIQREIETRTGVSLAARTVRRWFNESATQQKVAS